MTTETQDALKPFEFHGVTFRINGENAIAECPLCGKSGKFGVKIKTGQYHCLACGSDGNVYTFLEQLWNASKRSEIPKALQRLADDRRISAEELCLWGTRLSQTDLSPIIPLYNTKGRLANLTRVVRIDGKYKALGTPGLKLHPFGTQLLRKQQTTLWVCEGPWDGIALSAALRTIRESEEAYVRHHGSESASRSHGVIAVPGATSFAVEWLQYFANRDVRLVFDNDYPREGQGKKIQPGWDGMQRVVRLATENDHTAKSISFIKWGEEGYDPDLEDGYDVRDLLTAGEDFTTMDAVTYLDSRLVEADLTSSPEKKYEPVEPLECKSFGDLCEHYAEVLHFPEPIRQTLAVAIAVVISTNIDFDSEQLWFRIIGPAGSTKTTIAECLSVAREMCFPKSILTGFHSGSTHGVNGGSKKDNSLIPLMNGKCVIMKDADTLLNAGNRDVILGELRDIYDGASRSHYRTGKATDYEDLRTTFLLCGTDALRGLNRSFLGERFLDCDILGDSPTGEYLDAAISSAFGSMEKFFDKDGDTEQPKGTRLLNLKQYTYGFLKHLTQKITDGEIKMPRYTNKTVVQIRAMGQLLSYMRVKVERERDHELCYRPRAELATRLSKQLVKLAVVLCIVFDKRSIDQEVMDIVSKVTHDTGQSFTYEIADYLYGKPNGSDATFITANLGLADTTVRRLTGDMAELGIITRREEPNRSGVGGRYRHLWILSPEVRELFRLIRIGK